MLGQNVQYGVIFGAGLLAGFLNVLAGGGSLLTLPVLLFTGMPAPMANGTNRVAILVQNVVAVSRFQKEKLVEYRLANRFALAALPGAVLGAIISVRIPEHIFRGILAVVLVGAVLGIIIKPHRKKRADGDGSDLGVMGYLAFACFGLYGGFIQAGIGIVFLIVLYQVMEMSLVKVNAYKVYVVGLYTLPALLVFVVSGNVEWVTGGVLAAGNATGALFATHFSIKKGEKFVRWAVVAALILMAGRLFWDL